jgi:anti-sigma factor RsiW
MNKSQPITEADLHAYADGHVDEIRRSDVEAWLEAHPERAAEIAGWVRQNEAIRALFVVGANEQPPTRLSPHALAEAARKQRTETWPRLAAAAVVILAMGGTLGWVSHGVISPAPTDADLLIDGAVAAHHLFVKEKRHAVEVEAVEEGHLVSWLSDRLQRPITPPDLAADGFTLVGGRLLPSYYEEGESNAAAQLMYENAAAERITVYITAAHEGDKPTYSAVKEGGVDAFYWSDDRITCTVVGTLADAEMKAVAKKIYQQLTLRPDGEPTHT